MAAADLRQITIMIHPKIHEGTAAMAKAAGMPTPEYAAVLFTAAYSARCKPPSGDRDLDLDAAIRRILVLWGTQMFYTEEIAKEIGLHEATVVRTIEAWRSEMSGRVAA